MMTSPTIRRLCLDATLVHVLPGASADLRWRDGARRVVGAHPAADASACTWRDAVIQSAATACLLPHELLFGLVGAPRVEIVPGPEQRDMGGGVYRQGGVDVFATTLDRCRLHDIVRTCDEPGRASVGVRRDELTGVTIVAIGHLADPPPGAALAWAVAMACAIDEVSLST